MPKSLKTRELDTNEIKQAVVEWLERHHKEEIDDTMKMSVDINVGMTSTGFGTNERDEPTFSIIVRQSK